MSRIAKPIDKKADCGCLGCRKGAGGGTGVVQANHVLRHSPQSTKPPTCGMY